MADEEGSHARLGLLHHPPCAQGIVGIGRSVELALLLGSLLVVLGPPLDAYLAIDLLHALLGGRVPLRLLEFHHFRAPTVKHSRWAIIDLEF
jgi:hypothetical protein